VLSLALAALDCAAGVYLVLYARHRERRDPDAVGYFLIVCAVVLVGLELLLLGRDAVLRAPMCGRPQVADERTVPSALEPAHVAQGRGSDELLQPLQTLVGHVATRNSNGCTSEKAQRGDARGHAPPAAGRLEVRGV